jgi:hypothetical protein
MKYARNLLASCTLAILAVAAHPGSDAWAQMQSEPLATGMINKGTAEAQVVEATRHGEILTIKVRFKGLTNSINNDPLYLNVDKSDIEKSFYILVGNKKYLLLTDTRNVPLTTPSVVLNSREGATYVGSWYGSFPAPPADVKEVYLTMSGVEPLGPIAVKDR